MIRILIVEDQKIMQKYFEYLIENNKEEFQHVQTIADAYEAIKICNKTRVHFITTMDLKPVKKSKKHIRKSKY